LRYSNRVNRAEFKKLGLARLDDARVLLKNRRYSAAYYLAGYAVECSLKACLARKTQRYQFPPDPGTVRNRYYTHNLQILAEECDVVGEIKKGHAKLQAYWNTIKDWTEESRYKPRDGKRARDILLAIEDPADGMLQCIKRCW
jgi:HEPN domain-containing protein